MPKIAPVPYQVLVKLFEAKGFRLLRQKGDHLIYTKDNISRPVVIPMYKEVPVFIIKNNLRTARISREEYLLFIQQI